MSANSSSSNSSLCDSDYCSEQGNNIPIITESIIDDNQTSFSTVSSKSSPRCSSRFSDLLSPPAMADACDTPYTSDDDTISSTSSEVSEDTRKKDKIFLVAKEMMKSEEVFANFIKFMDDTFRKALCHYLPEDSLNVILKNFPQLKSLNDQMLNEFKSRVEEWNQRHKIADVFVRFGPYLKLYSLYIIEYESICNEIDELSKRHPSFGHALREFEISPVCQKLPIKDHMLKGVQRIPQYKTLLQRYLGSLGEDHPDYGDAVKALEAVSKAAEYANERMKREDNFAQLLQLQDRIFGSHEIVKPGRCILKQGELLKLSRKEMQPRLFVLCNDCLFYLTMIQQGMYKLNYELPLRGMRVEVPKEEDFQHEFSIRTPSRSFTLSANSLAERDAWLQSLSKAIKEFANRRSTFTQAESPTDGNCESLIGHEAPVWVQDSRVTMCQIKTCLSPFTVTFRRHHCRACGLVVCSNCSSNKAPLKYLKYRAARVCDPCFEKLKMSEDQPRNSVGNITVSSGEVESDETSPGFKFGSLNFVRIPIRASGRKKHHVPKVLQEVTGNDAGSAISGHLYKSENGRTWKKRWFVIKDKVLYSYKASHDVAATKSIPLLGYEVIPCRESSDVDKHMFQLRHRGQPQLYFRAETSTALERWLKAMQEATVLE